MDLEIVSPDLLKLGRDVAAEMATEVMAGAGVIRLQLLASRFYEAIKTERDQAPQHGPKRRALTAAADQCHCSAATPHSVLVHIRTAVAMLTTTPEPQTFAAVRQRPQLRVINGGLA